MIYSKISLALLSSLKAPNEKIVAEVQSILKKRGYFTDEITGLYNYVTKEALLRFQEDENIRSTPNITPLTYCRLKNSYSINIAQHHNPCRFNSDYLNRPNILISKASRFLTLFDGNRPYNQFPIAIGKPSTPTPLGDFAIATKVNNPGGVLGSRWMGLNFDTYGIHGTNRPWLIGQMVSNGCIRMHNEHVEELFHHVPLGTPVLIRD